MKKVEAIIWLVIFIILGCIHTVLSPFIKAIALFLAFTKGKTKQYGINVWEGVDNSISADTGGSPDDSLSSRLGKAREKGSGWGYVANKVDLVFGELFGDEGHCQRVIERDRGKKQVTNY